MSADLDTFAWIVGVSATLIGLGGVIHYLSWAAGVEYGLKMHRDEWQAGFNSGRIYGRREALNEPEEPREDYQELEHTGLFGEPVIDPRN